MFEMTNAGEGHRDAVLICGGNRLFILYRSAWLDDRGDAETCCFVDIIANREERIRSQGCSFQRESESFRTHRSDSNRIDAVHLSRAYPKSLVLVCKDDGIRFDVFAHAPSKKHCINLRFPRLAFGHEFQVTRLKPVRIRFLD